MRMEKTVRSRIVAIHPFQIAHEKITGLKTRHYGELWQRRAEFAGGESVEGAEAGGEFGGSQAAVAVEAA